jgi:two-component system sensor histidine kinase RegB
MNFSTLFRTKENLNLDKSTLTILRYIAIFGQFIAVNLVYFFILDLKFPIKESYIIIFIGLLTNLFLQFKVKVNQLKDTYASLFLLYDLFQLSSLLYLTGGILNPFSILMIIPTIVSSTFLSMGTTIILGSNNFLFIIYTFFTHLPLPGFDYKYF